MTGADYRAAVAALNMDNRTVAKRLDIGFRSSCRYAKEGAPVTVALALQYLLTRQKNTRRPRKNS